MAATVILVHHASSRYDVLNRAQRQNAKECANDITHTTAEHRAADDGGCNGIHFRAAGVAGRTGTHMHEIHETTDTCQQAAQQMRQEFGAPNIYLN